MTQGRRVSSFIIISIFSFLLILNGCGSKESRGQASSTPPSSNEAPQKVKNVILMIGDGMGVQQTSLAMLYRQLRKPTDSPLALEKLMKEHDSGLMRTTSYGDIVTDSAAAATVLACGIKTLNEIIGMDPNGYPCETILEKAAKQGKSTGLVSTSRITHATPGGFVAHQVFRNMENEIAEDIIEDHEVDVLLSGGTRYFIPQYKDEIKEVPMKVSDLKECQGIEKSLDGKSKRVDQKNLIATAKDKGYRFVCNKKQLEKLPSQKGTKVLGLFSQSVFPMIQERNQIQSMPNLAEMTKTALDILSQNEKGFFLMVEGALIDYAGHDNDAGTMLQETLDFDKAIEVAMQFSKKHPDTLLIVTADHETGGFGFAYGKKIDYEMALPSGLNYKKPYSFAPFTKYDYLATQKKSFRAMVKPIEKKLYPKDPSKVEVPYTIGQATGELISEVQNNSNFTLTKEQALAVLTRKPGKKDAEPHDFSAFYVHASIHPDMLGRVLADQSQAVWAAGTHTSTPVPVLAMGPARYTKRVRGFIDNTEIYKIMEDAFNGR